MLPCYIRGAFAALPLSHAVPRPKKIVVAVGSALQFENATNDRAGWQVIARALEQAVQKLNPSGADIAPAGDLKT